MDAGKPCQLIMCACANNLLVFSGIMLQCHIKRPMLVMSSLQVFCFCFFKVASVYILNPICH